MNGGHITRQAVRETDCAFLLRVLSDGRPHNLNEILRRSFADRDCGLTVHSRAAQLRDARYGGHDIRNWKDGTRGDGSWYRLIRQASPLEQPPPVSPPPGAETTATHDAGGGCSNGDQAEAALQLTLQVAA